MYRVRFAIIALVLLTAALWLSASIQRHRVLSEEANASAPQRLTNQIASGLSLRSTVRAALQIEWAAECRPGSIIALTPTALSMPQRRQLAAALQSSVMAQCGPAADGYRLAFGLLPARPREAEPQSPLRSTLVAGLVTFILGIGKWLDYRTGPKHIALYKLRVKALHRRFERDSWQRLLWRAVVWTDALLTRAFGASIWRPSSIFRAACVSLVINLFLAYPVLLVHMDSGPRVALLESFPQVLLPAVFACMNTPWDVLSLMAMRELFTRMSNPALGRSRGYLLPTIGTFLGIALFAWFAAGFSVLAGTVLSNVPLTGRVLDRTLWSEVLPSLFVAWYPAAMLHPMTAQLKVQDINMGFMGIGALTACLALCAMLIVLLVWRYLGPALRGELGKLISTFSEDTKSHFSVLAAVPAGIVLACFWLVYIVQLLMASPS